MNFIRLCSCEGNLNGHRDNYSVNFIKFNRRNFKSKIFLLRLFYIPIDGDNIQSNRSIFDLVKSRYHFCVYYFLSFQIPFLASVTSYRPLIVFG